MTLVSLLRRPALALGLILTPLVGAEDASKLTPVIPLRNNVDTTAKKILLDFNVNTDNGPEKNVLWRGKLGKVSYAGPVISGGKVLVSTNNENPRDPAEKGDAGVVMCFDARSGKFLWQSVHKVLANGAMNYPKQGIASTPCVDGDRVYYVSNRAEVVCCALGGDPDKPGKAKILWTHDMIAKDKVFPCQLANSSPLVVGEMVYVVTGNGVDVTANPWVLPAPDAPSFLALDKKTGAVKWKDSSPGKNIMEGQWTGATFCHPKGGKPQVLFPGGDGWLYSFEPLTGKLIWKFNCNTPKAIFNPMNRRLSDKAYFLALPVVYEDRVYIGTGCNPDDGPGPGHFFCIDPTKTGDVSVKTETFDASDPKNKASALVWHFGGKIVPRPARGREVYFGRTMSTPAIHDGLVYVAELDGYMHCFDAKTGKQHWVEDLSAQTWCSPLWVDDKVLLGTEDGDIHVFASGKTMKRVEKISIGPPVKTPAQFADGVMYILTDSEVIAVGKK